MENAQQLVERYVGVWNEPDPAARRRTIEGLWSVDGRHQMGDHDALGHDALEARVSGSHERSVVAGGNVFRPAGAIQQLPSVVKFRWDMARRDNGALAAAGVGFLMLDADGKIARDWLFAES
jgi:hypothetical protein